MILLGLSIPTCFYIAYRNDVIGSASSPSTVLWAFHTIQPSSLLLRSICGTENSSQQTSLQCLSTINMVFSNEDKILIKSLYLKGYTANRLTDKFPEKSWTKHGANKLLKQLRDTGTVDRRPGSGRPRSEKKIAMPSYA